MIQEVVAVVNDCIVGTDLIVLVALREVEGG